MKVVSVLKVGKGYSEREALLLHNQLRDYDSICMTDLKTRNKALNTVPLGYAYPGWWSKINLFNPDHPVLGDEDLFYIDLDTVITGDISKYFNQDGFTALTDFYNEKNIKRPMASGIMWIPAEMKHIVWDKWIGHEFDIMVENHPMPYHGDQGFIYRCMQEEGIDPLRWQELYPHEIISYKKDVACRGMRGYNRRKSVGNGKIPPQANIVCFHGNPRPWNINLKSLY